MRVAIQINQKDYQKKRPLQKTVSLLIALPMAFALSSNILQTTQYQNPQTLLASASVSVADDNSRQDNNSGMAEEIIQLTNQDRIKAGFSPLLKNPELTIAAQNKANDMAEKNYFSHTSPQGLIFTDWIKQAGYDYAMAGENLAVNFSDMQAIEQAWLNSPKHRANILKPGYQEIGIGIAPGTYKGYKTFFVTAVYGAR